MRFPCVVLLFTCLVAVGALVQPSATPYGSICQENWECPNSCFCYKLEERQQRGQCVCIADLKTLNECTEDRECIERDSRRDSQYCRCERDFSYQPTGRYYQRKGQCKCTAAVGLHTGVLDKIRSM